MKKLSRILAVVSAAAMMLSLAACGSNGGSAANGDSPTCSTIINGFVSSNVDLILANATAPLQAAAAGTDSIPVIGGNGAGKSTLMNAIAGAWPVDEGSIVIDGVDVTKLSEHKRAAFIGRVFQDPMMGTAATMGIEENLALAKRRGKVRTLRTGITRAEREE